MAPWCSGHQGHWAISIYTLQGKTFQLHSISKSGIVSMGNLVSSWLTSQHLGPAKALPAIVLPRASLFSTFLGKIYSEMHRSLMYELWYANTHVTHIPVKIQHLYPCSPKKIPRTLYHLSHTPLSRHITSSSSRGTMSGYPC